jgi:hypothetical protein
VSRITRVSVLSDLPAVKFLGVLIDPALSFKPHISNLKSKLSKSLFALRQAKNILPEKSLTLLYYAMFHSHLTYAIPIWSCCSDTLINDCFKMQKKAVRIITNSHYNDHTEPLFKKLEILPLPDLISFSKIQIMQRFSQGFLPTSFNSTWNLGQIRQIGNNNISLRNQDRGNFFIPFNRLKLTDRMPLFNFPRVWESFPDIDIKFIRSKKLFDSKLKSFFLKDLSETVTCNRFFCPACYRARTT